MLTDKQGRITGCVREKFSLLKKPSWLVQTHLKLDTVKPEGNTLGEPGSVQCCTSAHPRAYKHPGPARRSFMLSVTALGTLFGHLSYKIWQSKIFVRKINTTNKTDCRLGSASFKPCLLWAKPQDRCCGPRDFVFSWATKYLRITTEFHWVQKKKMCLVISHILKPNINILLQFPIISFP